MTNPYRRFGIILGDVIWYTLLFGGLFGVSVLSSSLISKLIRIAIAKEAIRTVTKKENEYTDDDFIE